MVYYMTTGRNSGGAEVNAGRTITRTEALRLYCGPQQGWFSKEEDRWGGIAVGRYADLAVLAAAFDHSAVPDDRLRAMTSVLTIVDGKVRHDAGALKA
jgi:predicted amidohydrolase YtcJ